MLIPIEKLAGHIFGVQAVGQVTEVDLKNVLLPGIAALVERHCH